MSYFDVLPFDLRESLLHYFWISEINKIIDNLEPFMYLSNNNRFWQDIYTSHFNDTFKERNVKRLCLDFRELCKDMAKKLNDTKLTGADNFFDSAIKQECYNAIPYIFDRNNFEPLPVFKSHNEIPRFQLYYSAVSSLLLNKKFYIINNCLYRGLINDSYCIVSFVVNYRQHEGVVNFLKYINETYPNFNEKFPRIDPFYKLLTDKWNLSSRLISNIVSTKKIIRWSFMVSFMASEEIALFRYLIGMNGDRNLIPQDCLIQYYI